ncbi:AraC family transcriptional regulator [Paraburkholderia tuberum]|uniref:Helix-turn-helix domain-containing protein n=1 Tax=Paraburkholderia tuberum TaxID=157910 RepID=A0A1H1KCU5_9BURK|nr:AraC family transcriptional regulator [Paraburkholderia tuberum]SDR60056.1 Helix-turn-helix domain-containing protein [Paraburkholderia tuberum]
MLNLLRSSTLTNYVEVARASGLDPYRQLRKVGISKSALLDPDIKIAAKSVRHLLEESAQVAGVEDFGLRMAETRQLENLGPLAIALREEPTLRKALNSLVRYFGLHNESLVLRIEEADGVAIFSQELIDARGSLRQSVELGVCVMYRILKQLLGAGWKPRGICFTHSAPVSLATHRRLFVGTSVLFNQDFDGLVLAEADLDAAIMSYDPALAPHAREFLDAKMAQSDATMPEKVRKLVFALLPTGACVAERVAQELGVDRKTMYRHLVYHGHSYSTIVDAVRVDLATRYVENRERPLSDVATLLGFASLSAFSRWFSGRFGCSVSKWRRE